MTKVKFYSGTKSKIDTKAIEDGAFYVSTDTDELLTDVNGVRKSLSSNVTWSTLSGKPSTFPPSSHTHSYAGSSSAGGSATSAVKLDTSAGSATQPVYFASGKPTAISYTIGTSVPSGAKFTDTTYGVMTGSTASAAGTSGLVPIPAAGKNTSFLRGDGSWVVPTNTTYGLVSTTANGLAPKLPGNTTTYFRGDGTWGTPPNTTYTLGSFGITATAAQLNFCSGVTSNIQTQLNGKAATSHSHNYAGSSSAGGSANSTQILNQDTRLTYGFNGLNYFNITTATTSGNTVNATPIANMWYHIIRLNHSNSKGYLADIAVPFESSGAGIAYRRITNGTEVAWRTLFDTTNYTSYVPTKTGSGASGTWGISITGNSATSTTATKANQLTTARAINGTSFNGTANITTANWGTARTLTIGSTGKSVNGSANVSWTLAEIGAAAASHSHSYLPLSGGTLTGGQIARAGISTSWVTGRNVALLKTSSCGASQYCPIISAKSEKGSWELGPYTSDILHLSYITDTNFNAGTNAQTADIQFTTAGGVVAKTFSGALSGNASTATALTTNAGSASKPVYFSGGKPVACTSIGTVAVQAAAPTDSNVKLWVKI